MDIRTVRYFDGAAWQQSQCFWRMSGTTRNETTTELNFGERYVVAPCNPRALPRYRGRICTLRRMSFRSERPRATVVFEDDGTQATLDIYDLLSAPA